MKVTVYVPLLIVLIGTTVYKESSQTAPTGIAILVLALGALKFVSCTSQHAPTFVRPLFKPTCAICMNTRPLEIVSDRVIETVTLEPDAKPLKSFILLE